MTTTENFRDGAPQQVKNLGENWATREIVREVASAYGRANLLGEPEIAEQLGNVLSAMGRHDRFSKVYSQTGI